VKQQVVICKIDEGIRKTSIETVICKILIVQCATCFGFNYGHGEEGVRIFSKITIAHNTL